jgi:hypothetical protein
VSPDNHTTPGIPSSHITRPASTPPPEPLVEAAMRDVPPALADMNSMRAFHAPVPQPGQKVVVHHCLVQKLREHNHTQDASEWAIHRLVEKGMLTPRCGYADWPAPLTAGKGTGPPPQGESYAMLNLPNILIESTPLLWEWWATLAGQQTKNKTNGPRWDQQTRTLELDGVSIKTYRKHPAANQEELLTAFEAQGWSGQVVNPWPTRPATLPQTVKDLNSSLPAKTIRFVMDGTGEGVLWERDHL